ncbi:MAG: flavin reductase family protein [Gemmatimonadota bacterium]|nr:flavin reductase family protein [Gemmatimonadota bacterium]MDE2783813.1 flavin reductase family protein [Gemmatimonadota bacterium]MDE2865536.1 flavin reductase family protein [Gemmatimonadota bacterium]MXV95735.1 flavin reductase family protein [Gemmatimonadota bacterium]MXX55103.1 flavin reductase family protein [Gemmatimonadota bacterium]
MNRDTRLEPARFRRIMRNYPTGVTVVTALHRDGTPFGLTANSVASVSLDPPLVLVCVSERSSSLGAILSSGAFAVNVLGAGAASTAKRFAEIDTDRRFENIRYTVEDGGSPILEDVVAWMACSLYRTFEAGDHMILVGRVHEADASGGDPLLFFRGRYESLDS